MYAERLVQVLSNTQKLVCLLIIGLLLDQLKETRNAKHLLIRP